MPSIFYAIIDLMRLRAPTGFLLCYFPSMFGVMIGYKDTNDLKFIPLFLFISIVVRGAGCTINDIFDREFDKHVERTKNRPLPSGRISVMGAIILLVILTTIPLSVLFHLNETAKLMSAIAALLIFVYPLMKRITYFPQVFLGFAFNMGVLIGYGAVQNTISINAIMMYLACAFWTIAYDTIYGFMDFKDDKKIGIKSTSLFFEKMNYKMIIALLYTVFFILFLISTNSYSIYVIISVTTCLIFTYWNVATLNINKPNSCMFRFKANNYVGFLLFLGLLLEKL